MQNYLLLLSKGLTNTSSVRHLLTKLMSSRKEFKHPVLEIFGIKRLRVPHRNWLIFWGVIGGLVGAYRYDQSERRRIKEHWKEKVSFLAAQPMAGTELPRKVTVYIAPPPQDFLDVSQAHFRNYIKPILTAAAVDHEIIDEKQQGHIRTAVAQEIREKRRGNTPEEDEIDARIMAGIHRDDRGGALLIGRGAYKEWMSGLQEGWLGPLEEPESVKELKARIQKSRDDKIEEEKTKAAEKGREYEPDEEDKWEEENRRKYPVEPAWLRTQEYDDCAMPREMAASPFAVFRHPRLLGIHNFPWRIYRFFNQRYLADEMGRTAAGVVLDMHRPFQPEDVDLAVSDEDDWPHNFKKKGADKDSEWTREFSVDPRIGERLEVYEYIEKD